MVEEGPSTLQFALSYYRLGFSVIPLINGTKKPAIKWLRYRTTTVDQQQIYKWFEHSNADIAIITGLVSCIVEFDIDGQVATDHFLNTVENILDEDIRNKIKNTTKIKTGNGNINYILGLNATDFPNGEVIKSSVLWRGKENHSEISLKADGAYAVAPPSEGSTGQRYELIGGIKPEVLSKQQLVTLIAALKRKDKSVIKNGRTNRTHHIPEVKISEIISLIKPYYRLGLRNDFVMYLSGWLRKEGIVVDDARKIVEGIDGEDGEKTARLRTLEETYKKEDLIDVKGYSGLLEILTNELQDKIQARKLLDDVQGLVHDDLQTDSEKIDETQRDIIREASEAIMDKHRFITIEETREIWYYRGGVYVPGGEILIEKEAEKIYEYSIANRHLSEIKGHIMRSTYHPREDIDSDLYVINLKNGLYDLRSGDFNQHSPDYLSISQLPVSYIPKAKPKLFGKFLREVLYPSEIRTAVELMAYTLYHDNPFELITILFGYGANGKSVFTGLLTALHGTKNVSNVPLSAMLNDKFALSDLEGKSANIDTELTGTAIRDTSVLKKLTGRQATRIQRKNQRAYDSILSAKLFFSANKIPEVYDESDAFFRRKIILSFPNRFEGSKDDPELLKRLTTSEELSGIFNVLTIALRRLLNRNQIFVNEKTIEERRERYMLAVSPIEAFLKDAVAEDSIATDSTSKEAFYQAYKRFCNTYGLAIQSKESLGKILKSKFEEGRESSGERRTVWKGIKLALKYHIDLRQETLNV